MPSYQRYELLKALFETSCKKIVKGRGILGCTVGHAYIDVGNHELHRQAKNRDRKTEGRVKINMMLPVR